MKKSESVFLAVTLLFIGACIGYFTAMIPEAGTFKVTVESPPLAVSTPSPAAAPAPAPAPAAAPSVTPVTPAPSENFTPVPLQAETPSPEESEPVSPEPDVTPAPAPVPTNGKVNINTADLTELQRLPGVGPAIAQRILDDRALNGSYRSVAELLRVKGIGEKTLEKILPMAEV